MSLFFTRSAVEQHGAVKIFNHNLSGVDRLMRYFVAAGEIDALRVLVFAGCAVGVRTMWCGGRSWRHTSIQWRNATVSLRLAQAKCRPKTGVRTASVQPCRHSTRSLRKPPPGAPRVWRKARVFEEFGACAFSDDAAVVETTSPSIAAMVERRWAMAMTVLPFIILSRLAWMAASTSESSALVARPKKNRCVFEHHAGDGDALALTAESFTPRSPTRASQPRRPLASESSGMKRRLGAFGGGNHFGIGRVRAAVNNVVAHGTVQQRGSLRDQTDLGA